MENIDGAKALDHLVHHVRDRGGIGHIAGDPEGRRAVVALQLRGEGGTSVRVKVHDRHLRPEFGEAAAKPLAENTYGAGNNGGFSI